MIPSIGAVYNATGGDEIIIAKKAKAGQREENFSPWVESWEQSFFVELGGGTGEFSDKRAIIIDPIGSQAFSEGLGYGLLIEVQIGNQNKFNKLLEGYLRATSFREDPLSAWRLDLNGNLSPKLNSKVNATDADADVADALLRAADKWKNTKYREKYLSLAREII